jgi:oxaloacetate decarboxylase
MISISERRRRLRTLLSSNQCVTPASIFDPISARLASQAGYTLGMLGGSVASQVSLAAPDVNILTLTELADMVRRMTRASDISLFIDADHGFGNALSVARTAEELEHAGACGFSIEDTALPTRFGQPEGSDELISLDEMLGKLQAAVSARRDPDLVIAGRSSSLKVAGLQDALRRTTAMAKTGVDAIFLIGVKTVDEVRAIHDATRLPIILGTAPASLTHADLAAAGARILLQGHLPLAIAAKALTLAYQKLFAGAKPGDLSAQALSAAEMDTLTGGPVIQQNRRDYLTLKGS